MYVVHFVEDVPFLISLWPNFFRESLAYSLSHEIIFYVSPVSEYQNSVLFLHFGSRLMQKIYLNWL